MHITENPLEKPWLQHQLYKHTKTILRVKRVWGFTLCHSLSVKIHISFLFRNQLLKPFCLCVSVCTALQLQVSVFDPGPSKASFRVLHQLFTSFLISCPNPLLLFEKNRQHIPVRFTKNKLGLIMLQVNIRELWALGPAKPTVQIWYRLVLLMCSAHCYKVPQIYTT